MAIRKIKNSWWVDFRIEHTRYRKRSPENTRAGAAAYEAQLRQRLARGAGLQPSEAKKSDPLFAAFVWTWYRDYVIPNNKFAEQRAKRGVLTNHLIPFFGRLSVGSISSHHIEQFKAQQVGQGASNKAIRNRLTVLNKCLACAHDWLELDRPLPKIRWPKCPQPRTDYLSTDECKMLLGAAEGLTYEMILTTLRTGMRQGELKGLQWSSIDWQNRSIVIRHSFCDVRRMLDTPKSNRERHIPLDAEVMELLTRRRRDTGYVFLDNGRPFNRPRLNARLAAACEQAGLRRVTWHVLRHTFATNAAMRGIPLQIVQHLLGHSTVTTTERYAHVAPSMLRVAIDLLSSSAQRQLHGQPVGNQWSAAMGQRQESQVA